MIDGIFQRSESLINLIIAQKDTTNFLGITPSTLRNPDNLSAGVLVQL